MAQTLVSPAVSTPLLAPRSGSSAFVQKGRDDVERGLAPASRRDERLGPLAAKVARGERLTLEDGDVLYSTPDIWSVCELADQVRRQLHGDVAFFNVNRHLNYSNVCALSCKFCEFYRKQGEEGSYTRDMEYVKAEVRGAVESGATEMHSVGGLHPHLPFEYYTDLVSTIRDTARALGSDLHVKSGLRRRHPSSRFSSTAIISRRLRPATRRAWPAPA